MTEAATPAQNDGYIDEVFVREREADIREWDGNRPVWSGCADDGYVVDISRQHLVQRGHNALAPSEGMQSNFGQFSGMAVTAAAVGLSEYGPRFLAETGGFDDLTRSITESMSDYRGTYAVLPAGHSARPQERAAWQEAWRTRFNSSAFCDIGNAAIACAYASNVGRVPEAVSTNPSIQSVAESDLTRFLSAGEAAAGHFEAFGRLARIIGPEYAVGRQDLVAARTPVMILGRLGENDTHMPAEDTAVIFNLDPRQISRPRDHYRVDLAGTALVIRRAVAARFGTRFDLPADKLMQAMVVDAVAVRTLLASHDASGDHTPDPRRLRVGTRGGSVDEALGSIEEIEGRAA